MSESKDMLKFIFLVFLSLIFLVGIGSDSAFSSDWTFVRSGGITGTSFSFDIGSAGTDRLVVVIADDESSGNNLAGVTVDGKSCNLVARADNAVGLGNHQEMWYCDEDDLGSSNGAVTVAISGGDADWGTHGHLYTGVSQSGFTDSGIDQSTTSGTTITVTGIDVPAGGLVVMGAATGNSGGFTTGGWTSPLTERTDGPNPSSAVLATASGAESSQQTGKSYTATADTTITTRATGIVAVWPKFVEPTTTTSTTTTTTSTTTTTLHESTYNKSFNVPPGATKLNGGVYWYGISNQSGVNISLTNLDTNTTYNELQVPTIVKSFRTITIDLPLVSYNITVYSGYKEMIHNDTSTSGEWRFTLEHYDVSKVETEIGWGQ